MNRDKISRGKATKSQRQSSAETRESETEPSNDDGNANAYVDLENNKSRERSRDVTTSAIDVKNFDTMVTSALIEQNDTAIDLTMANKPSVALSSYLSASFLAPMLPMLKSFDLEQMACIRTVFQKIADLEASFLLIKSSLVKDKKFVIGDNSRFVDPLAAFDLMAELNGGAQNQLGRMKLVVPVGPTLLGSGWHADEERKPGEYWRWSGPTRRSTLVLPLPGPGRYRIGWDFLVLDNSQAANFEVTINGQAAETVHIEMFTDVSGRLTAEFEKSVEISSSYFFVSVIIPYTVSPDELFSSGDTRLIGWGLGEIHLDPI